LPKASARSMTGISGQSGRTGRFLLSVPYAEYLIFHTGNDAEEADWASSFYDEFLIFLLQKREFLLYCICYRIIMKKIV